MDEGAVDLAGYGGKRRCEGRIPDRPERRAAGIDPDALAFLRHTISGVADVDLGVGGDVGIGLSVVAAYELEIGGGQARNFVELDIGFGCPQMQTPSQGCFLGVRPVRCRIEKILDGSARGAGSLTGSPFEGGRLGGIIRAWVGGVEVPGPVTLRRNLSIGGQPGKERDLCIRSTRQSRHRTFPPLGSIATASFIAVVTVPHTIAVRMNVSLRPSARRQTNQKSAANKLGTLGRRSTLRHQPNG